MSQLRILALMGGVITMGSERGNIEALAALQREGAEVLCVTRKLKWAVAVPQAIRSRGLATAEAHYLEHRSPGRLWAFLFLNPMAFVLGNIEIWRIARRFRPTHLHAPNQMYVWSFLLALLLLREPMVFRAGDEPTTPQRILADDLALFSLAKQRLRSQLPVRGRLSSRMGRARSKDFGYF